MWELWFEFTVYSKVPRWKALLTEQLWDLRERDMMRGVLEAGFLNLSPGDILELRILCGGG